MKKAISWYNLYEKIGKQTIHKTKNTKVQIWSLHNNNSCSHNNTKSTEYYL